MPSPPRRSSSDGGLAPQAEMEERGGSTRPPDLVTDPPGASLPAPGGRRERPAFLPSALDPTVFDEGFLRQLERLKVMMRAPVRGGLKGGRRSVKRGQSVEFADFRDYALGDDLRQLDWNVLARLEKLFIKLYVEEEDVTIHFLIDASASMASGEPSKLLFAQRAAAALALHRPGVGGPGRDLVARRAGSSTPGLASRLGARLPVAGGALRDRRGRRPDGPRDRRAACRRPAVGARRHRPALGSPRS